MDNTEWIAGASLAGWIFGVTRLEGISVSFSFPKIGFRRPAHAAEAAAEAEVGKAEDVLAQVLQGPGPRVLTSFWIIVVPSSFLQ